MQQDKLIDQMLSVQTIAIVGISEKPDRPSYQVAEYLSEYYTVIPVNPGLQSWLGLRSFPSISALPDDLQVDLVDIFRRSEDVLPIVEEVIQRNSKLVPELRTRFIWMQLGIENEAAKSKALRAGVQVVMNACTKIEHLKKPASPKSVGRYTT